MPLAVVDGRGGDRVAEAELEPERAFGVGGILNEKRPLVAERPFVAQVRMAPVNSQQQGRSRQSANRRGLHRQSGCLRRRQSELPRYSSATGGHDQHHEAVALRDSGRRRGHSQLEWLVLPPVGDERNGDLWRHYQWHPALHECEFHRAEVLPFAAVGVTMRAHAAGRVPA
jgi:hypothetical protein